MPGKVAAVLGFHLAIMDGWVNGRVKHGGQVRGSAVFPY